MGEVPKYRPNGIDGTIDLTQEFAAHLSQDGVGKEGIEDVADAAAHEAAEQDLSTPEDKIARVNEVMQERQQRVASEKVDERKRQGLRSALKAYSSEGSDTPGHVGFNPQFGERASQQIDRLVGEFDATQQKSAEPESKSTSTSTWEKFKGFFTG